MSRAGTGGAMSEMTPYYKTKLEEGLRFQDVATRELYQRGIVIVGYSSRHFQFNEGENMLGAEIKRDGRYCETGNLYIETAEKSNANNEHFIKSGIHREDNSWLYVIGDETILYIFSTNYLRMLEKQFAGTRWKRKVIKMGTSKGFLIPKEDAEKYAIRIINL